MAPMNLLLLADPSLEAIDSYLQHSVVFVGSEKEEVVAVAAVRLSGDKVELKNIAVLERRRGVGLGKQMLDHSIAYARAVGAASLWLGTGNSSLSQLAFYQAKGFRMTGVVRDYFLDYSPPIYENGIRCVDRVLLAYDLNDRSD